MATTPSESREMFSATAVCPGRHFWTGNGVFREAVGLLVS